MNSIKAFLFDLDGVIVDTAVYHYQAWKRMANALGFDIDQEFDEHLKGVSRMQSLDLILEHGKKILSQAEKEHWAAQKNTWYLELVQEMTPEGILEGIPEFLKTLQKNNIKIGLGSVSKNAQLILEKVQLLPYFDAIIDGTKIINGKPDPEVFLKGAATLGLLPQECIVVEDAAKGVEAANRAGMKTIGIGFRKNLPEATIVIKSFKNKSLNQILSKM